MDEIIERMKESGVKVQFMINEQEVDQNNFEEYMKNKFESEEKKN